MIETKQNFEKMDVELDSLHGFEREFNIRSSCSNINDLYFNIFLSDS